MLLGFVRLLGELELLKIHGSALVEEFVGQWVRLKPKHFEYLSMALKTQIFVDFLL